MSQVSNAAQAELFESPGVSDNAQEAEQALPSFPNSGETQETQEDGPIEAFIAAATAELKQVVAKLESPSAQPDQALRAAILAWQIVRALCDSLGLQLLADRATGRILGFAGPAEQVEQGPTEAQEEAQEARVE